ncbi:pheromone-binding protein Gp-9-like [Pseudomyrmex gracilis]|uniref:pheromone-binding protein Gp-9-like n=1 Tax=Pseudomyrmex gracilis TaxID=219809 RepID=UPI0009949B69|nr:pheromone-binding protein Gp-9-like [Pseudomyrmex gracilis]
MYERTFFSSRRHVESVLPTKSMMMKSLTFLVCLIATLLVVYTDRCDGTSTFANVVHHIARLPAADQQQCYESASLTEAELLNKTEVTDGSYKNPENEERARKNGCYAKCMLEKRGMIVDTEIQTEKLKGTRAHQGLPAEVQKQISDTVDHCVDQVKTINEMCDKILELMVCFWKGMRT